MSTSVDGNSQSGSSKKTRVSDKPWHMTWNESTKQLFIWKSGRRLYIGDGVSAGPASAIESIDKHAVKVIGEREGKTWKARLSLKKVEKKESTFMSSIAEHLCDSHLFCKAVSEATGGVVEYGSGGCQKTSTTDLDTSSIADTQESEKALKKARVQKSAAVEGIAGRLDSDITSHYIGTHDIPVDQLRDPPACLRVRDVKQWYVNYLADELRKENHDLEELTAPLLVLASTTKEEFRTRDMSSYTFEVVGGVHRFLAILKINEDDKKKFSSRKCAIYGTGLSRNAILRLANQHNEVNKVQRMTSFAEVASSCRRLLFIHFGEGTEDDGKQMPQIPRYNSQKYRDWKTECMTYLSSPTTSTAFIETALQMALQSSEVYHLLQEVFTQFEHGELKGQQQHKLKGAGLQKALQGKYSAKLQHFKMFQGLKDSDKIGILRQLSAAEISLTEAAAKIKELKQLQPVRDAFTCTVEASSWEEAVQKYPTHTADACLRQFVGKDMKEPSNEFMEFCKEARLLSTTAKSSKEPEILLHKGSKVSLLECKLTEISVDSVPTAKYALVSISAQPDWGATEVTTAITRAVTINKAKSFVLLILGLGRKDLEEVEGKLPGIYQNVTSKLVTLVMPIQEDADHGVAQTMVTLVAHIGEGDAPPFIADASTNGFVCIRCVEESQFTTVGPDWLNFVMKKIIPRKSIVLDMFWGEWRSHPFRHQQRARCVWPGSYPLPTAEHHIHA